MTKGEPGDGADPRERATEVADRLHSAAIRVLRYLRKEDEALGISAPRLSALSVLVFRGPLSVGELAAAEQVTAATTSRLVSELEGAGLAERTVDPDDARVRRVSATPRGVQLLQEGRRRRVARLARAIEGLTSAERVTLERSAELIERMVRGGS